MVVAFRNQRAMDGAAGSGIEADATSQPAIAGANFKYNWHARFIRFRRFRNLGGFMSGIPSLLFVTA